jgi:transposase InsO family protein
LEGLEAFVEKKTEFNGMLGDHIADLQAVTQEQIVISQGFERAAKVAEERRFQEFQHALERMDPVEAEAARRAEQERGFRLQSEREARLAELNAEFARIRARVRAKYPDDI